MAGCLDFPEPGNREKCVNLRQRHDHAGDKLRREQVPPRQRAHEQGAHVAHLAIVDHREGGLHPVEELDQQYQSGRDVNLVQHIGFVGWNDGHAEHLPKAGGENEQPDQRADQRGHEPFALMQKAQSLPPNNALEADRVLERREAGGPSAGRRLDGHDASLSACNGASCVSRVNAARISCAPRVRTTVVTAPCARTRP